MSSSNKVRLTYIEEVSKGVTPGAGNLKTFRFTNESLSGTPNVSQSEEVRSDRQSAGQSQVGLAVGGSVNFEMAAADCFKDAIRSAMKSPWTAELAFAADVDVTVDATSVAPDTTLTLAVGDWDDMDGGGNGIQVGDLLRLEGGFAAANEGKLVYVKSIDSATVITVVGRNLANETAMAVNPRRPSYTEVGDTDYTFTFAKSFLDLTDKEINYPGMLVDQLSLNFTFGQRVQGVATFAGMGYGAPATPITDGRTIDAATTERSFNASSDVGAVLIDEALTGFCIQSLGFQLSNNHTPDECLGNLAPQDYTEGEATISVTMNAYLRNENFSLIQNKIDNTPVSIIYSVQNADGGMAVHLPKVDLTFPDPASAGRNQTVSLEMTGTAAVDPALSTSMRIYWI